MSQNSIADSASRAVRLLEVLAGLEQPASLRTITETVGLSKASTYRLLRALQDDGFIDHIGRSGYRIGNRAVALATLMGPRPALVQRAHPILSRLAALSGETATMHLRSGNHRTMVQAVEPVNNPERRIVRMGERSPLVVGCVGMSILANLPEPDIDPIIESQVSSKHRAEIRSSLGLIRRDGFATSSGDSHRGLNGIAAPLLDPDDGYAFGSIAIAGKEERLSLETLRTHSKALINACTELAPKLAAILGPNSVMRYESLNVTALRLVHDEL